jgi:hypothetical protein
MCFLLLQGIDVPSFVCLLKLFASKLTLLSLVCSSLLENDSSFFLLLCDTVWFKSWPPQSQLFIQSFLLWLILTD